MVRLYNLDSDIAEQNDLAPVRQDLVDSLTLELITQVENGRSTAGTTQKNDLNVNFKVMQRRRWMP